MAGEVSKTSVILQTRLTQGNQLINGDLPGNPGKGRFRISTSPSFGKRDKTATVIETVELHALPANDCILKTRVTGLEPPVVSKGAAFAALSSRASIIN